MAEKKTTTSAKGRSATGGKKAAPKKTATAKAKAKAPAKPKEPKITGQYITGLGRRKEATAQVRLFAGGQGQVIVNNKELKAYFPTDIQQRSVLSPLAATGTEGQFDVTVRVVGGGIQGQAESVRLGIARALVKHNEDFKATLRKSGFLTRDARKKERKKYGKRGARRSPQWSKR